MNAATAKILAILLDEEETFTFVADRIADSRDKARRVIGDRDSADVLAEVIDYLREAAT